MNTRLSNPQNLLTTGKRPRILGQNKLTSYVGTCGIWKWNATTQVLQQSYGTRRDSALMNVALPPKCSFNMAKKSLHVVGLVYAEQG